MLSTKSGTLHSVAVSFSWLNFSYLFLTHTLALVALLFPLRIPTWLSALLFVAVLLSAVYHFILQYRAQNTVCRLIQYGNGHWCVVFRERILTDMQLDYQQVYLSSYVMVLPMRSGKQRYSVMLWRDSVSYKEWRMLHAVLHQQVRDTEPVASGFSAKL